MNVSDLLNPLPSAPNRPLRSRCISTPVISSNSHQNRYNYYRQRQDELYMDQISNEDEDEEDLMHSHMIGKPRSRFSEYEDNVIRQGVAQRLTWGQISDLLPHRKRATCFNRYRTLQGIRKSRKSSTQQQQQSSESENTTSLSPPFHYSQQPYFYANSNLSSSSSTTSSSDENDDFPLHSLVKGTQKMSLPSLSLEHSQPYYQSHSLYPF
ncbi:hypothetical protein EDC96DRAFT_544131 [Choanephora cucurbitarum]|nr:hypothetical protein EDC96DRAFT_544131 [Choanephora cucurbitarum]